MYDSETDRKMIAEAYAENAQFSMNIFNSSGGYVEYEISSPSFGERLIEILFFNVF